MIEERRGAVMAIIWNALKGIYKGTRIILFGTGYYCNHIPSCSEYAFNLLSKEFSMKSLLLVSKRLLLCNFFNKIPRW